VGACACYLSGFLRFKLFDYSNDFGWIMALQLLIVVVAGGLIPILTGSVLTLHFTQRRLDNLMEE